MVTLAEFALLFAVYVITGKKAPEKLQTAPGGRAAHQDNPKPARIFQGARFAVLFGALCLLLMVPLTWFGAPDVGAAIGGIATNVFGNGVRVFAALALIIALIAAAWDVISDKELDRLGRVALIAAPFLAVVAIGPVAEGVTSVTGGIQGAATTNLNELFG